MGEQANLADFRRVGLFLALPVGLFLALLIGLVTLAPAALSAGGWTAPEQDIRPSEQTSTWQRQTVPEAAPASSTETTRTIEVDAIADDDPGGGCTLREAIDQANFDLIIGVNGCTITESGSGSPATYVINLPSYVYVLTGASGDDINSFGDLDIRANVTIVGAGAEETKIDALDRDRVFHIDPTSGEGLTVTFLDLTIQGGLVNGDGAGIYNDGDNTVNLGNCTVSANNILPAGDSGAGIYNKRGTVNVINSLITNNQIYASAGARARGGGIHTAHGTLNVSDGTILNNTARVDEGPGSVAEGGGIFAFESTVSISNTLLSENDAICPGLTGECDGKGGGIYLSGSTLSLVEGSTVADNQAKDMGGGIYSLGGTTTVVGSNIRGNTAAYGAGAYCLLGCRMTIAEKSSLHHNQAGDSGGSIYVAHGGRATVDGSAVIDNTASRFGGGIFVERAALTLNSSFVGANSAIEHSGGGIYDAHGDVTLKDSTVAGNIAGDLGGGICSSGHNPPARLALDGCTVSGNTADSGGGISLFQSPATLTNTTVSGNRATTWHGGGIEAFSDHPQTVGLLHCTITDNSAASDGGGVRSFASYTVNISNTIVAGNSAGGNGPDIAGTLNSQDYNLIQDTSGVTIGGTTTHNITGQDPRLGPLAHNGGDTQTHALLSGSPAIDAIPEASCPLPDDQRGVERPQHSACDIGAFEADMARVYLPLVVRNYD